MVIPPVPVAIESREVLGTIVVGSLKNPGAAGELLL
jgi:hypothetical protein